VKRRMRLLSTLSISLVLLNGCIGNSKDRYQKHNDDIKPVTLTMFTEDIDVDENNFENPVAKEIIARTGVTLKIEHVVGEVAQRVGLMIAAKDYPDLIYSKGTSMNQLVLAGGLRDLKPLIEEHGDNIKKLFDSYMNTLRYSDEDHAIYSLNSFPVDSEKLEPSMGFQLQHAVVKELGYPRIETVKDFEEAIKSYKEKYAQIEGKATIGLSLLADDWRWNISLGNGAGFATGAPDDGNWYINPVTLEAQYRFTRPEEKEYYKWLNHMNDIGLIDPDSFVQKYDQYIAKIADGRVLGIIDAKWECDSGEKRLKADGKHERTYGMYPVQLNSNFKAAEFRQVRLISGWGVGISSTSKHAERAMQFLDWMTSDEGHVLRYWGIEGLTYKVENGVRVRMNELYDPKHKDYRKNTGVDLYGYPFPTWGVGKRDPSGQLYIPTTKESIIENYSPIEKEVLAAYGKETWAELYPSKEEVPESLWGAGYMINIPADSELALILKKCDDTMKSKLPKAILAKPGEFDAVWEEIMNELKKNGVQKANEEFTKLVIKQVEKYK
jgi:putative aldouronate transport system substrate-binding protein